MIDEYKKGRLSVIKEMMTWVSSELSSLPEDHKDARARATISGFRRALTKTFEKLRVKENKTLNHEKGKNRLSGGQQH